MTKQMSGQTLKERIRYSYNLGTNNCKEDQIFNICIIAMFFPAIVFEESRYKSLRFLSVFLSIPWMVILMPILIPLFVIGFFQVCWQQA